MHLDGFLAVLKDQNLGGFDNAYPSQRTQERKSTAERATAALFAARGGMIFCSYISPVMVCETRVLEKALGLMS